MPVIYYPLPISYYLKAVSFWIIQQALINFSILALLFLAIYARFTLKQLGHHP